MEIVRQRKKRLLAWILTLVLCVGMWQGNVQATEGIDEGSVSGNNPQIEIGTEGENDTENQNNGIMLMALDEEEGVEEGQNPIVASETGDGVMPVATSVTLRYVDGVYGQGYLFERTATGAEFCETEDGMLNIEVDDATTSFTIKAVTKVETDTSSEVYEHKLISWELSGSGGNPATITGTSNTISKDSNTEWGSYIDGLNVTWGKIIVIKDNVGNILGVCYQQSNDSNVEPTSIELSPINLCENGLFFSGWNTDNLKEGQITGNKFTPNFGSLGTMYVETTVLGICDSKIVPSGGNFALKSNLEYQFGAGTWDIGDGYSYSGNQTFYVPEDNTYSFELQ